MTKTYRTATASHYRTLKANSRANRAAPTEAEQILWQALRKHQSGGRFRRQHAIDVYIADFICLSAGLVVEVDGGYHAEADQAAYDENRDRCFASHGYRVLRVRNEDVLHRLDWVLEKIQEAVSGPHPGPPPVGGREKKI